MYFINKRDEERDRVKIMKRVFGIALILLVCMTGVFVKGTMVSQAKSRIQQENEAYHEMEKEYIRKIREVLGREGFENSGVNLTKIIDEEGKRTYTMAVHNSKINRLTENENGIADQHRQAIGQRAVAKRQGINAQV